MAPNQSPQFSHISYVRYRIQSVDFTAYVELYDVEDSESNVVLRPTRDELEQQWIFKPVHSPTNQAGAHHSSFRILNAATENMDMPMYLTVTTGSSAQSTSNPTTDTVGESGLKVTLCDEGSGPKIWTTKEVVVKDKKVLSITCPSKSKYEYFLEVDENGKIGCGEEKMTNKKVENLKRSRQWKILEDSPSVATDTYRIRTMNGTALHMKSGGEVSLENVEKGRHQEWGVEACGNGKCTIKSVSEDLHLGWEERKDDHVRVRKSKEAQIWNVKALGDYTYTIWMEYISDDKKTTTTLSLTCGENHEVILKTNKIAHNRIWMFEPVDITDKDKEESAVPPAYNDATALYSPTPPVPGNRYGEIVPRTYHLKNVSTGRYIYSFDGALKVTVSTSGYPWHIAYPDSSGEFIWRYNSESYPYACDITDMTLSVYNGSGVRWKLDRVNDTDGGFCYYISPVINPQLAVTHPSAASNQFLLINKTARNATQLWKLIPA